MRRIAAVALLFGLTGSVSFAQTVEGPRLEVETWSEFKLGAPADGSTARDWVVLFRRVRFSPTSENITVRLQLTLGKKVSVWSFAEADAKLFQKQLRWAVEAVKLTDPSQEIEKVRYRFAQSIKLSSAKGPEIAWVSGKEWTFTSNPNSSKPAEGRFTVMSDTLILIADGLERALDVATRHNGGPAKQ